MNTNLRPKWQVQKRMSEQNLPGILRYAAQTFFIFFTFEGGHRPFFLSLRFLTSRFLRSRIFFANFILNFCSAFSCSFDSKGILSTGAASSLFCDGASPPSAGPAPSALESALTISEPLFSVG